MYTAYFGFTEKPFRVTPDPRFFFTNAVYQEAYASLFYGVSERQGFLVLTGEVGTGKTTLLKVLMNNLEATFRYVYVSQTILSFEELLSFICEELGLSLQGVGRLGKIRALSDFLIAQSKNHGTTVLLIDEAQNLDVELLEQLRILSNLETTTEKLLQIVLVGQPELETKLDQHQVRQLKQRVVLHRRLHRLKDQEVGSYIAYRLQAVGHDKQDLFTRQATHRIAHYAQGVPRLINVICDNALLTAYGMSQKRVSAKIVDEVASDLRLAELANAPFVEAQQPDQPPNREAVETKARETVARRPRRFAWFGGGLFVVLLGTWLVVLQPWLTREHLSQLRLRGEELFDFAGERLAFLQRKRTTSPPPSSRGRGGAGPSKLRGVVCVGAGVSKTERCPS